MNFNTEWISKLEERLVKQHIADACALTDFESASPSEKQINDCFKVVHTHIVNNLLLLYMLHSFPKFTPKDFGDVFEGEIEGTMDFGDHVVVEEIPRLCEELHVLFLNSAITYRKGHFSRKRAKDNLLRTGAVYTPAPIAHEIVSRTMENLAARSVKSPKILDFATGTGRFYREAVKCMSDVFGLDADEAMTAHLYAVDIDAIAVNICRVNAMAMLHGKTLANAKAIARNIVCRNALTKQSLFEERGAISPADMEGLFYGGFDAVVSNPPYLVLKPNARKMDAETVDHINSMVRYFRSSPDYKYAVEGMLNLYQLSLEAMLGMLKPNGEMGVICPSTLFADISASKLRKHLLQQNCVTRIKYFTEHDPLFENVTQATCIFHLTKGLPTTSISIEQSGVDYKISIDDVLSVFGRNMEIPSIHQTEWNILRKLRRQPRLKDVAAIRNKRGELDLTLCKRYITTTPTAHRLVRGNMIQDGGLADTNHEYVSPEFLDCKTDEFKRLDLGRRRLICQQISNQGQKNRLRFVFCEPTDILGNSCNYISADEALMPRIHLLLNSALLNWRFKLTSTNNHINNYELDELPIADLMQIKEEWLNAAHRQQDEAICRLYGLDETETTHILAQRYEAI